MRDGVHVEKQYIISSQMDTMPRNVTRIENGCVGATCMTVPIIHSELFERQIEQVKWLSANETLLTTVLVTQKTHTHNNCVCERART